MVNPKHLRIFADQIGKYMTDEEKKKLSQFEAHVRLLMEKHIQLRRENEELYGMVEEKEKNIQRLQAENQALLQKYANLKLAKMIEISDDEMKNAKQRLSKLVREVDKCIALLNV